MFRAFPTGHNFSPAEVERLEELDHFGKFERSLKQAALNLNSLIEAQVAARPEVQGDQVSLMEMHLGLSKNNSEFVRENEAQWRQMSKELQKNEAYLFQCSTYENDED